MHNNNSHSTLNFVNKLRGFHAKNDAHGRYDRSITVTIKKFCETHFDELMQLCKQDETIASICSLPIPELQQYWQDKLRDDANYNGNGRPIFEQVMSRFSPPEEPIDEPGVGLKR